MGTFKDTLKMVAKAHPIGQVVTAMNDIKEHEALMATSTPTPPPPPAPAPVAVVPTLPVTPLVPPPPGASPMGKPRPTLRISPTFTKPPVEDLTPLQQTAVAGVSDRPRLKISPPTPRPAPTPIERPRLKINMERVTPEPPAPTVLTPIQQQAVAGMSQNRAQPMSTTPAGQPINPLPPMQRPPAVTATNRPSRTAPASKPAMSRTQRRVMGAEAIARIRESLNNPKP
jgi:RecQ-mediated genome instability protein 1